VPLHWSEKTVAATGERLNEARVFRGIAEGIAEALDGSIETVIEINEGVGWPQFGTQFFSRDQFARAGQEQRQNLEGLVLEPDFGAVPAKFSGAEVSLKYPEGNEAIGFVIQHRE
jgi:hypothetical protein